MKSIRWTAHALQSLIDRNISIESAEFTINKPEYTVADPPDREIRMRRFYDEARRREMLLRVVVAQDEDAIVVITLYKTSQINRYLRGLLP